LQILHGFVMCPMLPSARKRSQARPAARGTSVCNDEKSSEPLSRLFAFLRHASCYSTSRRDRSPRREAYPVQQDIDRARRWRIVAQHAIALVLSIGTIALSVIVGR
jgi:hypothetical protein